MMSEGVVNSLWIRALGILAMVFSLPSFAFSQKVLDQILEQSPDTQKFILLAVAVILTFLCLMLLIVKIKLSSSRKKIKHHDQILSDQQGLLNGFKVGMLHLNAAGEIVFANQSAASFLGSKEDKLVGQTLTQVFDEPVQDQMIEAVNLPQYVTFQTFLTVSKRHLQLGFSKPLDSLNGVCKVVSVADVSNYQHKIDHQNSEVNYLNSGVELLKIARLSIDFDKKTITSDQTFSELLALQEPIETGLAQFKNKLHPNFIFDWEKALDACKKEHAMTFEGEFLIDKGVTPEKQGSAPDRKSVV